MKTISYVQSIILKSYYGLNYNDSIKIIFTDVPLYKDIDYIINKIFIDDDATKEFLLYFKTNYLFEKYLWLAEDCKMRCSNCSNLKIENAHLSPWQLLNEYMINSDDNHLVLNITNKIINAVVQFNKENVFVSFVDSEIFNQVSENLCRHLDKISNGIENIENFDYENQIIKLDDDEKLINKIGLAVNITKNGLNEYLIII